MHDDRTPAALPDALHGAYTPTNDLPIRTAARKLVQMALDGTVSPPVVAAMLEQTLDLLTEEFQRRLRADLPR